MKKPQENAILNKHGVFAANFDKEVSNVSTLTLEKKYVCIKTINYPYWHPPKILLLTSLHGWTFLHFMCNVIHTSGKYQWMFINGAEAFIFHQSNVMEHEWAVDVKQCLSIMILVFCICNINWSAKFMFTVLTVINTTATWDEDV